jgi:hypothetical protein
MKRMLSHFKPEWSSRTRNRRFAIAIISPNNKSPELELSQAFASFDKRALVRGVDGNLFPVPSHPFELDYAFDQCEQRIILSAADVIAGMDLRAVLPIDDVAGLDRLTAEFFAAQPLAV